MKLFDDAWLYVSSHRTRLLGGVQFVSGALGVVQTYFYLFQGVLSARWYAVGMMACGLSTYGLGRINTKVIDKQITQGASDSLAAANVPIAVAHTAMRAAGVTPPVSPTRPLP